MYHYLIIINKYVCIIDSWYKILSSMVQQTFQEKKRKQVKWV